MTVLHLSHVCFTLLLFSPCRSGAQEGLECWAHPHWGLGNQGGVTAPSGHMSPLTASSGTTYSKVTTDPSLYNRTGVPGQAWSTDYRPPLYLGAAPGPH